MKGGYKFECKIVATPYKPMDTDKFNAGDCLLIVAGHMGLTATVIVKAINKNGTIHVNGRTNTNVVFDDQWFIPTEGNIIRTITHFNHEN